LQQIKPLIYWRQQALIISQTVPKPKKLSQPKQNKKYEGKQKKKQKQ
jgi:hypothetical protein